jgi:hypothetical protein
LQVGQSNFAEKFRGTAGMLSGFGFDRGKPASYMSIESNSAAGADRLGLRKQAI